MAARRTRQRRADLEQDLDEHCLAREQQRENNSENASAASASTANADMEKKTKAKTKQKPQKKLKKTRGQRKTKPLGKRKLQEIEPTPNPTSQKSPKNSDNASAASASTANADMEKKTKAKTKQNPQKKLKKPQKKLKKTPGQRKTKPLGKYLDKVIEPAPSPTSPKSPRRPHVNADMEKKTKAKTKQKPQKKLKKTPGQKKTKPLGKYLDKVIEPAPSPTSQKSPRRPHVNRSHLYIPRECHKSWMEKCNLAKARDYKYAMKSALEHANVSPNWFRKRLRKFRLSLTADEFVDECISFGFGKSRANLRQRVAFIKRVLKQTSNPRDDSESSWSEEEEQELSLESLENPEEKEEVIPENSKSTGKEKEQQRGNVSLAVQVLRDTLNCVAHYEKDDVQDCVMKMAQSENIRKLVKQIDTTSTSVVGACVVVVLVCWW